VEGVGKNLRNQISVDLQFMAGKPNNSLFPVLTDNEVEEELKKYERFPRSGYFARVLAGPLAFIVSSITKQEGDKNWPDIQLFRRAPELGDPTSEVVLTVTLTRGKSVGQIGFDSAAYLSGERNDTRLALVDFKSLSEQRDVTALIEGVCRLQER
jgi:hypothetical protein